MIHFVPPHNEKIRAKIKDLATQVDVVLGNLEDAIPADQKMDARAGFITMARENTFGRPASGRASIASIRRGAWTTFSRSFRQRATSST